MGWKLSSVIINANEKDDNKLLKTLGFEDYTVIENKPFDRILNPDDNEVYIGNYKNKTIICLQDVPLACFEETLSIEEQKLNTLYPNTEICAAALHSVVNFYGYSITKNNTKIRVCAGSVDDGTIINTGNTTQEELELFKENYKKDEIDLNETNHSNEIFEDLGEELVFHIFKRYFNETLDSADDLLFETSFRGYSLNKIKEKPTLEAPKSAKWIKYALYVLLFLLVRFLINYFIN